MSTTRTTPNARRVAVAGTYNLRETGGYRAGASQTRWGKLYRSDALHSLTPAGMRSLADLGITLFIDLRSASEVKREPTVLHQDHAAHARIMRAPVFLETSETTEPAGVASMSRIYDHMVDDLGITLTRAVAAIAESGTDPVLVHCTAGKDRTGVVIALALLAVGVGRNDIIADYTATEANLADQWADRILGNIRSSGLPVTDEIVELVTTSPQWAITRVIDRITEGWGGAGQYLLAHGLTGDQLTALRAALTLP